MSTRPTRRAATRRTAVVDSDDDENGSNVKPQANEDSFEDSVATTTRRSTRRKVSATPAAPATRTTRTSRTTRKTSAPVATPEPEEPQQTEPTEQGAEPEQPQDEVMKEEPISSPVQPKATKRESTPRKSLGRTPELAPPTTPKAPTTPRPPSSSAPLGDITTATVNATAREMAMNISPIKAMDALLDKPMDIMLKQRTMTVAIPEDTTPKSRIVLTHLILTNFKSYAGRQEVGPFHASFSSVVGPNGSGKSNVIDSLLFVFGFRASKMRQGKISALIHNSAQYPDLDHCEVAVHFQEVMDQAGGGHSVIPDSEIIISRRAFKNNSSKYYINNKTSDFTTVTTLLKEKGVDLDHKRFLILQGEVESIAQMKPKAVTEHDDGLLEYLEDIIGTSKYKTPIEEAATKVEELNDICIEKSGRVQHVEKEKKSLEDKKDKALMFIRDENELTLKQSALYQLFIHECNENISISEEAVNEMQAQLTEELEHHQGNEQIIKALEKQYKQGSKECSVMDQETQALVKEMSQFDQERVKFEEKKKFLSDKRRKQENAITTATKAYETANETIEECTLNIEGRSGKITSLEESVAEEEAQLAKIRDSLKGKTQAFSDQITVKQKALDPFMEKINEKQSAIAVAESELNILQEKANAGAVALEDLQNKIRSIEESKSDKTHELKKCEAEKAALKEEADTMVSELDTLAQQEPKFRTKISTTRQKADEARSSLASTQTRGNVLTALMRMKESGRIEGFHGRLGNLGTIDAKYDVAVSTAVSALDNFVTESVEAGQQCIEYLRKNNLGRGNFICLDKLKGRNLSPIQTPENAPRLFDLVKTKEDKFRPAFYHAMQDTLVAKDLAQANRIAYGAKRWRVVTLDGELIDKSGTMSGGGKTVRKGLMSSKLVADITVEQVAQLEEARDAIETQFQEFQKYQSECETKLQELNDKLPKLETQIQKLKLELESSTRNIADLQKRIKEVSKEYQPSAADTARTAELEKTIQKLQAEVDHLHGETASVEQEIKVLQDKIMEVGGEKLRSQRAMVDSIKDQITAHNEEVSHAEVQKVKAEKQKIKLEKDMAKATKERDAADRDLEALQLDIDNQGVKADELRTQVEAAKTALTAKKTELSGIKEDLDAKTTELNNTRAAEIEMRNKLEENQKALVENQKRLRYWDEKISKLTLQSIEELTGEPASAAKIRAASEQPKGEGDDEEMADADADAEAEADAKADESDVTMGEAEPEEEKPAAQPAADLQELPQYTPDELAGMSKETLKGEIAALEEKTQNAGVDLGVLGEYKRRVEEHAARSSDLQTALDERDAVKKRCDDLRRMRLEGFMEGFSTISLRLKEMYQMITMGGNAELELVDSLDPFSEGILFSVMPPKKSWKNIGNLSGGEKTLSSLALVFALHHYKPTPLYVMDEIDAALDFRNVSIVANYIKERTKNAQFIVISLRNNMFELAARLIGVYKVNHMTKSVTIENRDFIVRPQQQQQQYQRQFTGSGQTTTLALR